MTDAAPAVAPDRSRRVAVWTVLGWHALYLVALLVAIGSGLANDSGFGDLVAIVLGIYGGGLLVVSAPLALALARRFTRDRGAGPGAALGWGTLATAIGAVVGVVVVGVVMLLMRLAMGDAGL
ncbi:hypothetical protein [Luedemannella flava]|uniref:hypothetical protein n=1 Tax=Luedemannella flava TaxID=349316 RepID=UPI0031E3D9AC